MGKKRLFFIITDQPQGHRGQVFKRCYQGLASLVLGILLFGAKPASAQVSSNEINYFSPCRQVYDDRDRLACYDELYDQAVRAANPQADSARLMEENRRMREELARIRGQSGGVAPVTTRSGVDDYGRSEPYITKRDKADDFGTKKPYVVEGEDGKEELIGRIASLQKTNTGWIVILEEGQGWKQMVSKRYALREGQEVRIYPTRWGESYRLSVVDTAGYIQVERIQ